MSGSVPQPLLTADLGSALLHESPRRGLAAGVFVGLVSAALILTFYVLTFPPEPDLDPADIAREFSMFAAAALVYRFLWPLRIRLLDIGFAFILTSLWMEVADEFTAEPRWVGTGVPAPVGIIGLFLVAWGVRQFVIRWQAERRTHQRADDALQRSHATLRAVVDGAPDAVWVKDIGGAYILANDAATRLMKRGREEILGRRDSELMPPDMAERRASTDREVLGGRTLHYEESFTDGATTVTYMVSKRVITDATKEPLGILGIARDISERKATEERLAHQATHDALTGLPNRAAFIDRLGRALGRFQRRADHPFAVLFVDLDDFKRVNDLHGHAAGDALLSSFAQSLVLCVRPGDQVARFGGEEFTVLLQDVPSPDDAVRVAERIQEGLRSPVQAEDRTFSVSASIGIALSVPGDRDADTLLKRADHAMYRAKAAGGARHVIAGTD